MIRIFIAYSSKDLVFKEEIRKRLRPLQRAGKVDIWDNWDIEGGANWDVEIKEKLENSDLILLLLSPDALASDYFYEVEASIALRRHEAGEAIAVGILLRPCDLKYTPFGDLTRFELLPKKGHPIVHPHWHHADDAYLTIFQEVDVLIQKIHNSRNVQTPIVQGRKEDDNIVEEAKLEKRQEGGLEQAQFDQTVHPKKEVIEDLAAKQPDDQFGREILSPIIGIDFGTSNSCVSIFENGKPVVIPNDDGSKTIPSIITFLENGEIKVGTSAKRQAVSHPLRTISSIKCFLGLAFSKAGSDIRRVPYRIVQDDAGNILVEIDEMRYSPQQIIAEVLKRLRAIAEKYCGETISTAVISVPSYFNYSQICAFKEAGKIAGLNIRHILKEPDASAIAFGYDKPLEESKIAIFDLGGGGFSFSILEIDSGVYEVKSTIGEKNLGGDAFDSIIIDWLASEFYKQERVDLLQDPIAFQRLKEAAEKARIELSSNLESEVQLPYIAEINYVPKHLVIKLSRTGFEALIRKLVSRMIEICGQALLNAGMQITDLDSVLFLGGASRTPLVQSEAEIFFGKKPKRTLNPDEAVAMGAAIQGGVASRHIEGIILLEVNPLPIGIETMGGLYDVVLEANTTIPAKKSKLYMTTADNQTQVEIHILQGERSMAQDNHSLGHIILKGIPAASKGKSIIEVSFDMDGNGVLIVSAHDLGTGNKQDLRVESISNSKPYQPQEIGRQVAIFNKQDSVR